MVSQDLFCIYLPRFQMSSGPRGLCFLSFGIVLPIFFLCVQPHLCVNLYLCWWWILFAFTYLFSFNILPSRIWLNLEHLNEMDKIITFNNFDWNNNKSFQTVFISRGEKHIIEFLSILVTPKLRNNKVTLTNWTEYFYLDKPSNCPGGRSL